jgi:hypothetical protein
MIRFEALARSHGAHLTGAFVVMGGWAFFANSGHGPGDALAAAALQGTLSALVTLSLKSFIERIAARLPGATAVALPPLAAFGVVGVVLMLLHRLGGTPEIFRTVALPLIAATSYAAIYSYLLWRRRRAGEASA